MKLKKKIETFNVRKLILAVSDMFIICVSALVSNFVLSATNTIRPINDSTLVVQTCLMAFVGFFALWLFGAYAKMWRYFRVRDYVSCILGTACGAVIVALIYYVALNFIDTAGNNFYVFLLLEYVISTVGIIGFRLLFRNAFLTLVRAGEQNAKKRTLVVGAGHAGKIIVKEIVNASEGHGGAHEYDIIGIVDDNVALLGKRINDVPVVGTTDKIKTICDAENIEVIIMAIPSCKEEDRRRILSECSKTTCKIKVIPYVGDLIFDNNSNSDSNDNTSVVSQLNDINVNDLLGRAPISFDKKETEKLIKGRVCMVTGGGGSIGSELVRQIASFQPKQVIIVDIYENNAYDIQQELVMEYGDSLNLVTHISSVRDYNKMKCIFERYQPEIVFHAAAHKHVPLMEDVPEEAVKNNVIGTFNVAALSETFNVKKFIMISTDKAVNPTNVMGATKRCCEMIVQYMAQTGSKTEFVTTRFGNVLGSNGSVIPLFKRQIETGKPVTVTHPDIIRYFMTIPEAVSLVLQAGAMAKGGEIFVLDMGAPVKIVTLAENLIRMYGKVPYKDVEIKFTGLRPGEKLYEELLMDEEGLKRTNNKKIFTGKQIQIDKGQFIQKLDQLRDAAGENDSEKTVEILKEIVPTFKHKTNR
ncbi:MAG: nucleoside-diphosphate sugar epimerase/dehydratase [Acutalibacteraceae bacterium]|nr:nucleoside-diphosphate sugar epimerase/dehydratase [Acutalibacteraceae bacterium]